MSLLQVNIDVVFVKYMTRLALTIYYFKIDRLAGRQFFTRRHKGTKKLLKTFMFYFVSSELFV